MHIAIHPYFDDTKNFVAFIKSLIQTQVSYDIPVLSIYISSSQTKYSEQFYSYIIQLFAQIAHEQWVHTNNIKLSVLGEWYALPDNCVHVMKTAIISTKDYDKHFVNFCVHYDGQQDIVESTKMIARKILTGKLQVDDITIQTLKENVYSSFFVPPSKLFVLGGHTQTQGMLLWDTSTTHIIYEQEHWWEWKKEKISKKN
ncbi:MAG: undecaprenyl diphosphate synthase family protein [Candidatus Woesearchaeota archaeon]